jgi:hypothetical protein
VDSAAHNFGPDSQETADAIARVDSLIGLLLQGIDNPGRQSKMLVNLIVVSDHGMAHISSNKTILLDEIIDMNTVTVPDINGAVVNIWPNNPNDSTVDYLLGRLRSGFVAAVRSPATCCTFSFFFFLVTCSIFIFLRFDGMANKILCRLHPYSVYRKDQLPYDFHLAKSPNVAPIIGTC